MIKKKKNSIEASSKRDKPFPEEKGIMSPFFHGWAVEEVEAILSVGKKKTAKLSANLKAICQLAWLFSLGAWDEERGGLTALPILSRRAFWVFMTEAGGKAGELREW